MICFNNLFQLMSPKLIYIDPGTGALLFSVLTGTIGVLRYSLKGVALKAKTGFHGTHKLDGDEEVIPLVIYSDDKRYWQVFEPICRELDARDFDVVYMTASPDDPALENQYSHVRAEFIGTGNKSFVKLNFLKATILLSTTPGLDVYQWIRSKDVKYYVHITHTPSELITYKMFGTDYYDALLLSGEYQINDCRKLEEIRNLPHKECTLVGIPYLDEMKNRLLMTKSAAHDKTILLAPSWGPNSILNRFGRELIDNLVKTGYHIIVRPHPQSFTSEKKMIDALMKDYPDLEWNRDSDNFSVLNRSDVLISDFSGIIFDFSLVFDKPVICAYTDYDKSACDAWWIDNPIWTETVIEKMGPILSKDKVPIIKEMIDKVIEDSTYAKNREDIRCETWNYQGEGAKRTADYLIAKYSELIKSEK